MQAAAPQRVDPPLCVLLFYHVTPIDVTPELAWHTERCAALGLSGRLRVAPTGLNGTLSGATELLRAYARAVEERHALVRTAVRVGAAASASGSAPTPGGRDRIDWKLDAIADTSQLFASLRVRPVAELVTLGVPAAMAPLDDAGAHISPREFHRLCLGAASPRPAPVLLDVRNAYEWRIGRFAPPPERGVRTLLAPLRHFSELPAWLAPRLELFKGRDVLLYCTGGVRCEAASALLKGMLRQACDDDDEDPRVGGVGGPAEDPPGDRVATLTQGCEAPAPALDCSARAAAGRVAGGGRVLQLEGGIVRYLEAFPDSLLFRGRNLVFDGRNVELSSAEAIGECVGCSAAVGDYAAGARCCRCRALLLVCGACTAQQHRCDRCGERASVQRGEVSWPSQGPSPPLRILCLHGFRQTADGLRGRLHHFARKLGPLVELVFLDAPHTAGALHGGGLERSHERPRRCWLHEGGPGRAVGGDGGGDGGGAPADGAPSPTPAEWTQHFSEGWGATEACVRRAVAESGPFDGVLGFAQGAAVAAALAAISAREPAASCAPGDGEAAAQALGLRFVVLCSGFVAAAPEHAKLFSAPIDCPSLHIVGHSDPLAAAGAAARDAEVGGGAEASELLARLFHKSSRVVVRHAAGHVLPCSDRHIRLFKDFFMRLHPPLTRHDAGGCAGARERALGTSQEAHGASLPKAL